MGGLACMVTTVHLYIVGGIGGSADRAPGRLADGLRQVGFSRVGVLDGWHKRSKVRNAIVAA